MADIAKLIAKKGDIFIYKAMIAPFEEMSKAFAAESVMNNAKLTIKQSFISKFDLVEELRKTAIKPSMRAATTVQTAVKTDTVPSNNAQLPTAPQTTTASPSTQPPPNTNTLDALIDSSTTPLADLTKKKDETAKSNFKKIVDYLVSLTVNDFTPPLAPSTKRGDIDVYNFPTNASKDGDLMDPRRSGRVIELVPIGDVNPVLDANAFKWFILNGPKYGFIVYLDKGLYYVGLDEIKSKIQVPGDENAKVGAYRSLVEKFLDPTNQERLTTMITNETIKLNEGVAAVESYVPPPSTIELIEGADFAEKVFNHLVSNEGFGSIIGYDVGGWRIGSGTNAIALNPGKVFNTQDPHFKQFNGKGVGRLSAPKIGKWNEKRATEDPQGPWWSHWDWEPENRNPNNKHNSVDYYLVYVNLDTGDPYWAELPRIKKEYKGTTYNIPFMAFDFTNATIDADPFGVKGGTGGGATVALSGHRIMWYPQYSNNSLIKSLQASSPWVSAYKQIPNGQRAYKEEDFNAFLQKGWTTNSSGKASNKAAPAWESLTPEAQIALIEITYGFGSIAPWMGNIHKVKMDPNGTTLQLAAAFRKDLCSEAALAKQKAGTLGYSAERHLRATMLMEVSAGKAPKEGIAGIRSLFQGGHKKLGDLMIETIEKNNLQA